MRWVRIIMILLFFGSCRVEFDPHDPDFAAVPIVFGLIDTDDSIHTIRLTKSFIGHQDAYDLAKDTVNLLYDSVRMIIQCLDINLNVVDSLLFRKVYFNSTSDGVFSSAKSWYYLSTDKFPQKDSFLRFRLKAWIYDSKTTIISTAIYRYYLKDRTRICLPSPKSKTISVYNEDITKIGCCGIDHLGIRIRFNYIEVRDDRQIEKRIEKFWFEETGEMVLTPAKLYMFIKNAINVDENVDFRIFNSLDILSYSSSQDLVFYNTLFNQEGKFFETPNSNIVNGYGLFGGYSKDSLVGLKFGQRTLDSLAYGQYTKGLKFVSYH